MTGWLIAGAVIGGLAVLLFLPARIHLRYDGAVSLVARYLGIPAYRYPKSPRKQGKAKPGKGPSAPQEEAGKEKLSGLMEKIGMLTDLIGSASRGAGFLLRHSKVRRLALDVVVAQGDAAETALLYGRLCAAVGGLLAAARNFLVIDSSQIRIRPDFDTQGTQAAGSFCWQVRPAAVIGAGICAGADFLKKLWRRRQEEERPPAAGQKTRESASRREASKEKGGTKV